MKKLLAIAMLFFSVNSFASYKAFYQEVCGAEEGHAVVVDIPKGTFIKASLNIAENSRKQNFISDSELSNTLGISVPNPYAWEEKDGENCDNIHSVSSIVGRYCDSEHSVFVSSYTTDSGINYGVLSCK